MKGRALRSLGRSTAAAGSSAERATATPQSPAPSASPTRPGFPRAVAPLLAFAGLLLLFAPPAFAETLALKASFGKEVDKTAVEEGKPEAEQNLCTVASGDTCQPGTSGSGPDQFHGPTAIAINQSTGEVYVLDKGNGRVERFGSSGEYLGSFDGSETPAGEFALQPFSGIAVDNSGGPATGDVYLADSLNEVIDVFGPEGHYTGRQIATEYPVGVAVDAAGDLWVAGYFARVTEFDQSGAATGTAWNTSEEPAIAIAVDSHDRLYVTQGGCLCHTVRYNSDGGEPTTIDSATAATPASIDPADDSLYVDNGHHISHYDAAANLLETFGSGAFGSGRGLAFAAAGPAAGDLYAVDSSNNDVDLFGPALILPKVSYHAPTDLTETSATVNAEADPNGGGEIEECSFEYGETEAYGSTVACSPPTPYTEPKQVSAELSGLSAGHTYHYRLLLSDKNGTQHGADQRLSTNGPPSIEASSSEEVTGVSAILAAQINPDGLETAYHFEYISDQAFQQNLSESKPGFSGALIAPHPDAHLGSGTGDQSALEEVSGLAAATTYHYRAFASNSAQPAGLSGPEQSFETEPALLIGATASEAITRTTATLTSKLDPDGSETAYHFSYITQKAYEEDGNSFGQGAQSAPNPDAHIGAANSDQEISQALTELKAGTAYRFRLLATNPAVAGNPIEGPEASLETLPAVKIDSTSLAVATDTTATLAAQINPQGGATTYHFSYITQKAYEEDANSFGPGAQSAPTTDASIGAGASDVSVSQSIEGLSPATLYRFRVLATGPDGSTEGPIQSFDTYPPAGPGGLPDNRAYEQVTPVNKDGDSAIGDENSMQASPSGERITFDSTGTFPGAEGASNLPTYMATRSAAGWSTQGLLPLEYDISDRYAYVFGWSDDLSQAAVGAKLPSEPRPNVFLRDSESAALHPLFPPGAGSPTGIADFAPSDLLFEATGQLLPGAAPGATNLYQWNHGSLSLIGLIPPPGKTSCGGPPAPACEAPPGGSFAGPYDFLHANLFTGGATAAYYTQNTLSADGSRAFFTAAETGQLYLREMRENGATTVQVSASQKTNGTGPGGTDPNGPQPAAFMAATPDGSHVFFTSCEQLTDDSTSGCYTEGGTPTGNDLYRYEAASGSLTDLTPDHNPEDSRGADVLGVLGTSEDGSNVYFAAAGALTGEEVNAKGAKAQSGGPNLYLSHDGSVRFIATLDVSGQVPRQVRDSANWAPNGSFGNIEHRTARVSAEGNVLLFSSTQPLTGYHNTPPDGACGQGSAPCAEFYRYDATSGQLDCVSCNPTGVPPNGNARLHSINPNQPMPNLKMTMLPRNLSADGSRVFFESPDPLVPSDTNGVLDVYEWEATGAGTCHRTDQDGGCLFLLSTGKSPDPSYFADASSNGNDAFFFTTSSLVGQDNDQIQDVYDARVGGGLPTQNPSTASPCSAESCKPPPSPPPTTQSSGSAAFSGPPNPSEPPPKCKAGFVLRHGACLRKHHPHRRTHHKRASHANRGGSK